MNPARRHRPELISLLIVCAAVCLAGCGTPSRPSAAAFDIRPASGVTVTFHDVNGAEMLSDGTMILPLDHYDAYMVGANEALVFKAATMLEQACMRAKGLTLPNGWGGRYLPTETPPLAIYGVATLTDAATLGYRVPAPPSPDAPAPAVPTNVSTAFDGQPGKPGCAEKAGTALSVSESIDAYGYVQGLRSRALSAVYSDQRVSAATAAWSACMKAHGYSYPDPLTAANDTTLSGGVKGGLVRPLGPKEKAAAIADVSCKHSVGYLDTFASVSADYQNQLIAKNSKKLAQCLTEWHDVLSKAAAIVHVPEP